MEKVTRKRIDTTLLPLCFCKHQPGNKECVFCFIEESCAVGKDLGQKNLGETSGKHG